MAVAQTRESPSPAPRGPFTYQHLRHLRDRLDERYRCEIIDGELFVSPSPGLPHQWVVSMLHLWLGNHVLAHKLGMVLVAPLDVIFSKVDVVGADLLYLTNEQLARAPDRGVEEAPTLVVEILSPSTQRRDRTLNDGALRTARRAALLAGAPYRALDRGVRAAGRALRPHGAGDGRRGVPPGPLPGPGGAARRDLAAVGVA